MITSEKAHRVIAAGEAKAKEIGQPMNIAVVDAGTNLKAFTRMDGAWLGSIDIAIKQGLHCQSLRHFDQGTRPEQSAGRPVLRHQYVEPQPGHDFRGRRAADGRWQDRWRGRRQRRQRRAGSGRRRGRGGRLQIKAFANRRYWRDGLSAS